MPPSSVEGQPELSTNASVLPIDLPSALRLAGARSLDVQLARERLDEAEAERRSAWEQFFPWISPGIAYHRRDGVAQAVPAGVISDAHYQSYSPGAALAAQWALGDALYNALAARQLVRASDEALESQRQDTLRAAAEGYFDLAKAKALTGVVDEAIRISEDYRQQLHQAVASGIAFRGDELRVQSQTEHYRITREQVGEQERVAGAHLALVLHLDARIALVPAEDGLTPLTLFPTNGSLNALVDTALRFRPELRQSQALVAAARAAKEGALYGPLVPTLGAQAFGGGLGGGPDHGASNLGPEGDYLVGLNWRIGPGGLFDSGRINAGKAREAAARTAGAKLKDVIIAEVVAGQVRVDSTAAQIQLAERNLATAGETLRLTRERKQFGVGLVLEDLQAQQALTQARSDYVTAVAEYDKAQYALRRATGGPPASSPAR